jgi:ABC-type transporter Mla subunit MlaD
MLPGKIATLLVIATVLSVIGALLVAWRYRAAMQALMKAPLAAAPGTSEAPAARLPYAADVAPIPVTLADNRQAERRLILAFLGITLKDDAHVDVVARIENRYLKFIRQTSLARLSKEGLIGNSFISIETSDTSAPALGKNAYLALMPGTDMEVIAQQVKDQVDPVIAELHTLLAGLNHPQGPFQQSLRHLAASTGKLNDTHTQLNSLLRHTDTLIDRDARQTLTAINRDLPAVMRQLNATTQATQAASQSLNDAMQASATQLPGLIRDSRLLIQQSNDTLDGLRQHWPLKQLSAPIAPDTGDIHGAQD